MPVFPCIPLVSEQSFLLDVLIPLVAKTRNTRDVAGYAGLCTMLVRKLSEVVGVQLCDTDTLVAVRSRKGVMTLRDPVVVGLSMLSTRR